MAALNAPIPSYYSIASIALISPPLTVFWALSFISSKGFYSRLKAGLTSPQVESNGERTKIWMIHGTRDEFTGIRTFRSLAKEPGGARLIVKEVDGAGHFYTSEEEGERLKVALSEWLRAM